MRPTRWTVSSILLTSLITLMTACAPQSPRSAVSEHQLATAHLAEAYGRLPLHFEENQGQADPSARFIACTGAGRVLLGADGLRLHVDGHPVRLSFAGGTPRPSV